MSVEPSVIVVTGIMGAGKSTVAQALTERLPAAVHLRGDLFRRMIVSGQAAMSPPLSEQARSQLTLRHELAAAAADRYAAAGFTVVVQDLYLGEDLTRFVAMLRYPGVSVVVLHPSVEVVEQRAAARGKDGYRDWQVSELDTVLREDTPRIGLWVDTSALDVAATVEYVLDNRCTALVATPSTED